jgi:cell wall-associated NlpC family hydrolase
MLCADGARNGTDLRAALYAYNNSQSYVSAVLTAAATYGAPVGHDPATAGASQGAWTPEIGQAIAARALRWLGWPYSFDAGNTQGPTYGRAVDHASRNDNHVLGFDCSGLVLYALAPWLVVDHDAAAQYTQTGSVHPAVRQLLPGDLVFWSSNGTVDGVGHVAVYLGDDQVVQAPYSGAYIGVSQLDRVEPGYFGATRPLT